MSYSLVADEEAGAYPPAYSSSSTTNAQNYVYLSASEDLVTSLLIDTDQPAIFGRFKDEQEQKDAKNALLAGHFVDVKVNLKGSQKAKIEVQAKDYTFQRRVVQIAQAHAEAGQVTHFELGVSNEGGNAILVVPDSFSGAVVGSLQLSPSLAARATCLVKDDADINKTRFTVAPLTGAKPSSGGVDGYSSVSNTVDVKKARNLAGQCQLMTEQEYQVEFAEVVRQEWEDWTRAKRAFWPRRLVNTLSRTNKFATRGYKVGTCVLMLIPLFYVFFFGGIFVLFYLGM